MAKFWKTPEFQSLSKEWEERLKKSGFEDAEKEVAGERLLKEGGCHAFRRTENRQEVVVSNKLTYFMLIAHFFEKEQAFEDRSDRLIMQKTADGKSITEISKELRGLGMDKHNRDTIRYVRRRYEHKWGIRTWKPEQMVSRRARTRS